MTRKVAFITGASRGIGARAACELAEAGYDVAITARTVREGEAHEHGSWQPAASALPGSLESVAAEVRARGREVLYFRGDLLEPDTLIAAADGVVAEWGRIDLLFNNATYQGPGNMTPVMEIGPEHLQKIYQANIFSPLALIQKVLPAMLERGSGMVINMVSGSALQDPPAPAAKGGWGFAYSSSKAALIRMAGVLRVEHKGAGVDFINVEPGFVLTEVMKANNFAPPDDFVEKYGTPPEAVGKVVRWLATDDDARQFYDNQVIHIPELARKLGFR